MKKSFIILTAILSTITLAGCSIFNNDSQEKSHSASSGGYHYQQSKYTLKDYAKYNAYGTDFCPSIGNPKLLIIPVWFTDSGNYIYSNKKETVRDDIRKAYLGSQSETGWHSVASFYQIESAGKCKLNGTVSEWYECGDASSKYYKSLDNTLSLVRKAENWYFDNHKSDKRTDYDSDSNGYLDGIMLIYGSPDYVSMSNKNADNMWAYCYWLSNGGGNPNYPMSNAFFWASYDFMYSAGSKAIKQAGTTYGHGDNTYCGVDAHTYIHEMGHVFGLDDYYDYSKEGYCPAGGLTMQDYNVCGHDPYSTIALGWTDPMIIDQTTTVNLSPFQNNHDVILLSPNYTGSPFDEYILIEYYTPNGLNEFDCQHKYSSFDKGPSNSGIRIWHIDSRLAYYKYDYQTMNWSLDPYTLDVVPTKGNDYVPIIAFTNSYQNSDHETPLGQYNEEYYNYNLLQLIRNDASAGIFNKNYMTNYDMFYAGDSFTISAFNKQFVKSTKLNNGKALGWSVRINDINSSSANITITKI